MSAPPRLVQVGPAEYELPDGHARGHARAGAHLRLREAASARWTTRSSCRPPTSRRCPGIVGASLVMPDAHWGYGFPIGGVAAIDPALGRDLAGRHRLRHQLRHAAGAQRPHLARGRAAAARARGRARRARAGGRRLARLRAPRRRTSSTRCWCEGARWAVRRGFGSDARSRRTRRPAAASPAPIPSRVSEKALERGQRPDRHARLRQPLPRDPGAAAGGRRRRRARARASASGCRSRWW